MTTSYNPSSAMSFTAVVATIFALMIFGIPNQALAHSVAEGDQGFISTGSGRMVFAYMYLGAKHMVTGYDHLLFLLGVIFFLYKARDIWVYVTLFAVGHSLTMVAGVLGDIQVNAYLIDAIIGFSVIYKAADNLGLWKKWFGWAPDTRTATFIFGLLHGFGLATKIQEFGIPANGLLANLLAFNIGVELGQLIALAVVLIAMGFWRRSEGFWQQAKAANYILMICGVALMLFQINEYLSHH